MQDVLDIKTDTTCIVKPVTRPGRPPGPTPETARAVLTAALDLLLSEGAGALTAQRLHAVTGVSRSTVYRHWPTPHAVLEALIEVAPAGSSGPTGDLGADLHLAVDHLCDRLRDKPVPAFLSALVAAAASDPQAAALRHRYVEDLLAPLRRALAAAGVPTSDQRHAVAQVAAPLLLDAVLLDRHADRVQAHAAVDELVGKLTRRRGTGEDVPA
jgi:AcrR family transcriptional regulator